LSEGDDDVEEIVVRGRGEAGAQGPAVYEWRAGRWAAAAGGSERRSLDAGFLEEDEDMDAELEAKYAETTARRRATKQDRRTGTRSTSRRKRRTRPSCSRPCAVAGRRFRQRGEGRARPPATDRPLSPEQRVQLETIAEDEREDMLDQQEARAEPNRLQHNTSCCCGE